MEAIGKRETSKRGQAIAAKKYTAEIAGHPAQNMGGPALYIPERLVRHAASGETNGNLGHNGGVRHQDETQIRRPQRDPHDNRARRDATGELERPSLPPQRSAEKIKT